MPFWGIYETSQDYIDALYDGDWISYDSETNTASITSISDFVKACKNAFKSVGAFDNLKATPHKAFAQIAPSGFSSDCTSSTPAG